MSGLHTKKGSTSWRSQNWSVLFLLVVGITIAGGWVLASLAILWRMIKGSGNLHRAIHPKGHVSMIIGGERRAGGRLHF